MIFSWARPAVLARYPEFRIYLSGITFPQDISSSPEFNYYKISNRASGETLAFIASLVEPIYEQVRGGFYMRFSYKNASIC